MCIHIKVTRNTKRDTTGKDQPLVRGWGATGPYSDPYKEYLKIKKNVSEHLPPSHRNYAEKQKCKLFEEEASLAKIETAADGIVRRAVAEFRFEAAKMLMENKWFAGAMIVTDTERYPNYYCPAVEKGHHGWTCV